MNKSEQIGPFNFSYKGSLFKDMSRSLGDLEINILNTFDVIAQDIRPLTNRQNTALPRIIRELSHQLTDERTERRIGYMNDTAALSAYIRYFMWWNLVRLTALFASLPDSAFAPLCAAKGEAQSILLDIGSGPLTVPLALWLSRPELRSKKIRVYCLDLSHNSLAAGEDLFLSIAAKTLRDGQEPWRIVRVTGALGTEIREKADFISCANMCNELFWNSPKPLEELAKKYAETIVSHAQRTASIFIAEPGIPRASRFTSLIRNWCIRQNMQIIAPCPHTAQCAMPGLKGGKWCHFVFNTEYYAPKNLLKLSQAAGLQKERASISFVFAQTSQLDQTSQPAKPGNPAHNTRPLLVRVISDQIRLPHNRFGRYACSPLGLTLITGYNKKTTSGSLLEVFPEKPTKEPHQFTRQLQSLPHDPKTKAVILPLQ